MFIKNTKYLINKLIILTIILFYFSNNSYSAQEPRFLGSEKKFRSFIYNPNEVYRYTGHYTYLGFIEFAEGESISLVTMGNSNLWMHESSGNRLFLKPIENNAETNMTVFTTGSKGGRVYHFELVGREAYGINDEDLVFLVKFIYPDGESKNIVNFPKSNPSDEPDMRKVANYNFSYEFTGSRIIAPIKIFDNGEFTYFQFSKKNGEIPAIYAVDSSGYETLVNYRVAGSYIITEIVTSQFTLRSGSDVVCVYNNNMIMNNDPTKSTAPSMKF
jgi:type IV secretion system protein VirB9